MQLQWVFLNNVKIGHKKSETAGRYSEPPADQLICFDLKNYEIYITIATLASIKVENSKLTDLFIIIKFDWEEAMVPTVAILCTCL